MTSCQLQARHGARCLAWVQRTSSLNVTHREAQVQWTAIVTVCLRGQGGEGFPEEVTLKVGLTGHW